MRSAPSVSVGFGGPLRKFFNATLIPQVQTWTGTPPSNPAPHLITVASKGYFIYTFWVDSSVWGGSEIPMKSREWLPTEANCCYNNETAYEAEILITLEVKMHYPPPISIKQSLFVFVNLLFSNRTVVAGQFFSFCPAGMFFFVQKVWRFHETKNTILWGTWLPAR